MVTVIVSMTLAPVFWKTLRGVLGNSPGTGAEAEESFRTEIASVLTKHGYADHDIRIGWTVQPDQLSTKAVANVVVHTGAETTVTNKFLDELETVIPGIVKEIAKDNNLPIPETVPHLGQHSFVSFS